MIDASLHHPLKNPDFLIQEGAAVFRKEGGDLSYELGEFRNEVEELSNEASESRDECGEFQNEASDI
jgi:hypothetical protein